MGKKILLAEDDANLRDTLVEALRVEGIETLTAHNGLTALEAYEAAGDDPPQVIVLDVLMPKMTGFDVAKALRSKGVESPIVFVSGVYKSPAQQEDAREKYGCKAYLTKPFDVQKLVDTIKPLMFVGGGSSGPVAAQPLPNDGTLLENPPLYLLWRAQREMHSGILELFGSTGERARVFVFKGRGTLAQHSDPTLNVGVELVRDGVIDAETFKQGLEMAMQRGVGLYDLIKGEGWATDAQMRLAYKALLPKVLERVVAMSGRFRWVANEQFTSVIPGATAPLIEPLLAGLRRVQERELDPHVSPRRPLRLAPGDTWSEVSPRLIEACGSDSLTRAINGRATIAQMLEAAPNAAERHARYRQVYLLMSTMAVRASTEVIPMAAPAAAPSVTTTGSNPPVRLDRIDPEPSGSRPQARPAPSTANVSSPGFSAGPANSSTPRAAPFSAGSSGRSGGGDMMAKPIIDTSVDKTMTFNDDEHAARQKISDKMADLDGKNLYDVLGVKPGADVATIKKAYIALARDFHTDAFAGLNLGSAQKMLDHVFNVIQTAHATLSDDKKRGEYEAKLKFEQDGSSTDVAALMQAESDLNRAQMLVERGELVSALKLIDKVVPIMPKDPSVLGLQKYCLWWQSKSAMQAPEVCKFLEDQWKLAAGQLQLKEFQGWIWMEINELQKAKNAFSKVLEQNPQHPGAVRGMRSLQRKMEEAQKKSSGGLGLGKFLKR